jgi:hypothetical protein
MRSRLASSFAIFVTVAGLHVIAGRAHAHGADPAGEPAGEPATPPDPNAGAPVAPAVEPGGSSTTSSDDADAQPSLTPGVVEEKAEARFGAGLRIRSVHIPKAILELFVEKAGTGVSGVGFGVELYRRKGDFELQVGLEYEGLSGSDGIWVDKGETLTSDDPDFVEFDSFGWFTIEVNFINHTKLSKYLALRYGGGAGLGILKGDVIRTDYHCTAEDEQTCSQAPGAENVQNPYDFPPVFPVINGIIGMQVRPIENVIINVEGGIRTVLFFGATVGYYF